jgi:ATP-binding cassette subfamily B protein
LIFDEATSSLDSLVEKEISDTIEQVSHSNPNLMTIVVAHRLSTVMHADMIYVMEKGSIVESGTHDQLVTL